MAKKEEKAIPEPIRVKGEMLGSYSKASISLAQHLKNTKEQIYFGEFKIWVRDLFFWLEMKIDFKDKNYKCLKKLQDWISKPDGTCLEYGDWIKFWFALRFKMEELNITKIEMEEEDLETILRRP